MANVTIDSLSETASSALTSSHFLVLDNGSTTTKLAALSAAIKTITTLGSAGAGVVKSIALGVLSQRDIVGGTGITVTQNTNDLTLSVTQADITISNLGGISSFDLADCDNSTSAFLSTVALGSNVSGTLPIANGGTGLTSFTANSVLLGGSSISTAVLDADKEIVVGTSSGPEMKTLTAGDNISITQDNSADTLTIGFTKGNYVETSDDATLGDITVDSATIGEFKSSGTKTAAQSSNFTDSVTANVTAGVITLNTATIAADSVTEFAINNTKIAATSIVLLTLESGGANSEDNGISVTLKSVSAGRALVLITNDNAAVASSTARKLHFLVIN